jgi:acetoin utilization deacetylase AcuC-like enzyme
MLSAGGCAAAVDGVMRGPEKTALTLTRPPGHHATPTRSMGFCMFNNVALAADHARHIHGLDRILIVDWDVHHGNGTQDIFYGDPNVTFVSIHRYGAGFYPGTGAADESGTGAGLGSTINVPLRAGTMFKTYFDRFREAVESAASRCKPQLIILSAGFDAHCEDPIGQFTLATEDFIELTKVMLELANVHCDGRLVSCLEGGYNLRALAASVAGHLETLLGAETPS